MKVMLGVELCESDKRHVLAAFVHRFTNENIPAWSKSSRSDGRPYFPQFANDLEWLQNTTFVVRKDGRLDKRFKHCCSHPTWPNGK